MKAEDWDARYADSELLWSAEPNRFVEAELAELEPGRGLDLACGEGRNAVWLAEQGWAMTGVDFSEVAIGKARTMAERRGVEVEWKQADVTEWVPRPSHYGLVLIAYLQIPFDQLRGVLRRAAAAVAPGGTFFLIGHARSNLEAGVGGPQDPKVLYTPAQVKGELGALDIVRAETVLRPTDEGDAIDVLVRATRPRG